MIGQLYKKYIPGTTRQKIYDLFLGDFLSFKRDLPVHCKSKFTSVFQSFLPENEINSIYSFIGKHGITPYPYPFSLEYKKTEAECFYDADFDLRFVIHNGKKLYFPRSYDEKRIRKLYRSLIIEQDPRCAHRYVEQYNELTGFTLLDVGAAEGIFTLDVIDYIHSAYLFECEDKWYEALIATFDPWKENVHIIKKYVSNITGTDTITLDDFLSDKKIDKLFLKMDIEGEEQKALQGAGRVISDTENFRCSVCTYHTENDQQNIESFLKGHGISTYFTDGYLFYDRAIRKAIIRGEK